MTIRLAMSALCLALSAPMALADEVTDTLDAARVAYEAGNIQDALEELGYATQLLRQIKTDGLSAFLPEAPEGWTRAVDTEMSAGMAMMGGGVGAEATYEGEGKRFKITMMADNPMVAGFAGMMGNLGLMPGIKRVRIGGERFVDQNGEIVGLIGNRVLVQASGAEQEAMVPVLEQIDFDGLEAFGK